MKFVIDTTKVDAPGEVSVDIFTFARFARKGDMAHQFVGMTATQRSRLKKLTNLTNRVKQSQHTVYRHLWNVHQDWN